ncbi:MAG: FHA domain-containing protein [Bifidobacteriaceae bacterium]|jgi:hypothetical protein|nr:FHA domain-containing protein [Bifidobacteriaceae bacterium]
MEKVPGTTHTLWLLLLVAAIAAVVFYFRSNREGHRPLLPHLGINTPQIKSLTEFIAERAVDWIRDYAADPQIPVPTLYTHVLVDPDHGAVLRSSKRQVNERLHDLIRDLGDKAAAPRGSTFAGADVVVLEVSDGPVGTKPDVYLSADPSQRPRWNRAGSPARQVAADAPPMPSFPASEKVADSATGTATPGFATAYSPPAPSHAPSAVSTPNDSVGIVVTSPRVRASESTNGLVTAVVTEPGREPACYTLEPGRTVRVGRSPACEIPVAAYYASRDHAALTLEDDVLTVTDHSSGGLWLERNGSGWVKLSGTSRLALPIRLSCDCDGELAITLAPLSHRP